MPSYTFDITDKCVKFMQMSIKDMPGNPGQEVLVEDLDYSGCRFTTTVQAEEDGIDISTEGIIRLRSNHPEAIEVIMETAEQQGELITEQANIPGPWDLVDAIATGNWKIVGLDSEWKL
jgi:hypothetical protein